MSWDPMWRAMLVEIASGVGRARIAARFQAGIASSVATQNRLLMESVSSRLRAAGIHVLVTAGLPCSGGIALGQCAIAALASGDGAAL